MQQMLHELMPYISHYGLWIVFFGVMVEGTTMILLTGILCYLGMLSLKEAIPIAIIGAIIGDQFWYLVGKYYTSYIVKKIPSLDQKIKKLKSTIEKKSTWIALGSRFIYGGAILFPLTLGNYNYSHKKFTIFDTIGVTAWSISGVMLGYFLGNSTEKYLVEIEKVWHLFLILLISLIIVKLIRYYFLKKRENFR
jgi:membrane protein DedA with SNARE-associated domain